FIFSTLTILTSCIMGAGTHGSLKGYSYSTSKYDLENAINSDIDKNSKITKIIDEQSYTISVKENGDFDTTINEDYVKSYTTIKIKTTKGENKYTFRFYGNEEDWNKNTSEIFICYAYDEFGKGGSEGNGGIDNKRLKYLTNVFEKELIKKIDEELRQKHIETH
ncbi:MAG TPA: hypothetical protein PLP27_11670, partial [Crocinitomicaceae bacterium]|nr:hypothetical protein [Crocinitomicaceae bacterium]